MLRVANVGGNDIVYDLGCGDGRIVITAAEKLGARGIGVDLDPDRIKESNENAVKAGVTDRVRFVQADIFEFDITPASVLTLYLLPSVNLDLRPKIFSDLKPGTRVVSHDFDMDDWKPDHVSRDGIHTVYFWVVPANATGSWSWTMPGNNRRYELQVSQQFQQIQGRISSGGMFAPIKDAKLVGDQLTFTMEDKANGKITPLKFSGRVNGNTIEGAMERSGEPRKDWRAERDPSTVTSIEKSTYVNM
jgi:SAM-dependent methyltransferase